jgi:lipoprotein signal peptidase
MNDTRLRRAVLVAIVVVVVDQITKAIVERSMTLH